MKSKKKNTHRTELIRTFLEERDRAKMRNKMKLLNVTATASAIVSSGIVTINGFCVFIYVNHVGCLLLTLLHGLLHN